MMNTIMQILIALLCLFFVWRIYKVLKQNPELLSRENMNKSLTSMGFLAIILIGFVALLVLLLKH